MLKFAVIEHSEITKELLDEIIRIKTVAWSQYNYEQQFTWIECNINSNDIHVLLFDDGELVAYLNLLNLKFSINNNIAKGYGIGNVCALRTGLGYGKKLIDKTNEYLVLEKKQGILLCKEQLIGFYRKADWILLDHKIVLLGFENPLINLMVYNVESTINSFIYLGKLF